MNASGTGNDHRKTAALFACLFLAYIYKQMVWDAYFNQRPQGAPQTQAVPAATTADGKPNPTRFAEPTAPTFQPSPTSGQQPSPMAALSPTAPQPDAAVPAQYPSDAQIDSAGSVVVETDTLRVKVSLLGGRVTRLELKNYLGTLEEKKPLNLIEHTEFAPYPLGVYAGAVNDAWVKYQLTSGQQVSSGAETPVQVPADGDSTFVFQGQLPDGRQIQKTLTFHSKDYFLETSAKLSQPSPDASRIAVEWTNLVAHPADPYNPAGFVWFDGQKALREPFGKLESNDLALPNISWVSMGDKYFMTSLISDDGSAPGRAMKTDELFRARLYGTDTEKRAKVFAGPKSYRLLEASGYELKRNIDFGRTAIIAAPLLGLLHLLHDTLGNYGLAIVMLTIIVKLAMYPLTASSFKQMKAMQDLAPEMKRIRDSGKDKQQQQLETMALYRERGVNPLGGCFPILVQMPVFIGLYSALQLDIELRHAPFALWIHDLSAPEKLHLVGFSIPVMVILFVISMLVQQWTTPTSVDPSQKRAMLIMPLVFGWLFAKSPAALTLYWLTNNLISIGQQAGFRSKKAAMDSVDGDQKLASPLKLTILIAGSVFLFAWLMTKLG
ncbi:MAG: membrane protein insertase YidC [Bdellovibrionota bacterium]